jgi:hypothetical protein
MMLAFVIPAAPPAVPAPLPARRGIFVHAFLHALIAARAMDHNVRGMMPVLAPQAVITAAVPGAPGNAVGSTSSAEPDIAA